MGMTPLLPENVSMALEDISGMEVAVLILDKSLNPGMYNNKYLTFRSTRKRRGCFSSY